MRIIVTVSLKKGILDPASQAILQAIHNFGETSVVSLSQKRQYVLDTKTDNIETAMAIGNRLGNILLANSVMETFTVVVEN